MKRNPLSKEAEAAFSPENGKPDSYAEGKRSKPYPTEIGSLSFPAETQTRERPGANAAMHFHARRQIDQLQEHADLLVRQAEAIEKRVNLAERIGKARYSFHPVLLKPYFLYQSAAPELHLTLTLIAPEEWGKDPCPYGEFLAKVRQLGDSTWEVLDENS